ncbi:MAG: Gfo/Idh/MocA family oxidoreductase, partial [Pirellulaceae bacterium]|nr:Gfo/Idh/MocA family oxidoreductase [Pirellulaceae bacterium]
MISRKEMSRRQVLQRGVAAAVGAMALPQLVPGSVLAQQDRPGANDRIRIGAIGVGRQGTGLLAKLQRYPVAQLVAVADADIERAERVGKKFGAEWMREYQRILDRKDVDAIITATTDHWRSLVCIHAAQAKKDIYAEKPMTLTVAEGRKMVEAARKYGVVFQTGSQQRSMAINSLACELIRTGQLGKVKKVIGFNFPSPWECDFQGQPVPDGLDWDLWCGPTEPVPFHPNLYAPRTNPGWISFRPYSGGEVTGWGSHGFDQIQWALGMDESGPVEFWPGEGDFDPPTYREPESRERGERICATPPVSWRYANGVVVELAKGNQAGGIFVCEKG